jgi:hypothetical protein
MRAPGFQELVPLQMVCWRENSPFRAALHGDIPRSAVLHVWRGASAKMPLPSGHGLNAHGSAHSCCAPLWLRPV